MLKILVLSRDLSERRCTVFGIVLQSREASDAFASYTAVIPAKAGIQGPRVGNVALWVPASAGTTTESDPI